MGSKPHKSNIWWAILIGSGIALAPIHNQWLTSLVTNSRGEVMFFLPSFGYFLVIMGTGMFLLYNWGRVKEAGYGDKRILGCLLFIVLAISLSGANYTGWTQKLAPMGMGLALVGVYLASRVLKGKLFLPLAVGAVIASLGVIAHSITHLGQITGGYVFGGNYDIVVGYILLGVVLYHGRWRLVFISIALVGIFLTGSPEGVFALGVLAVAVIIRRDWSKKLVYILAPICLVAVIWFGAGWGQSLYSHTFEVAKGEPTITYEWDEGEQEHIRPSTKDSPLIVGEAEETAITHRLNVIRAELKDIQPLGKGYNLVKFEANTVHNVPLILVQQMGYPGIMSALAWLWISLFCLVRTRWKYAWVLVLGLSVFDHYIWTQLAPVWWAVIGASTTTHLKDYISR